MAIGHDTVGEVRVAENTFSGCRTQVMLEAEKESADGLVPAGAFVRAAHVTGNIGDGTALVLQGVPAVLVGGSLAQEGTLPAGARYCGPAKPDFAAPVGSLYSRTGGGALRATVDQHRRRHRLEASRRRPLASIARFTPWPGRRTSSEEIGPADGLAASASRLSLRAHLPLEPAALKSRLSRSSPEVCIAFLFVLSEMQSDLKTVQGAASPLPTSATA